MKLRRPRFLQHVYALTHGYFWLPCPICGRKFGGHEEGTSLMINYAEGICTCPECVEEATRRNQQLYQDMKDHGFSLILEAPRD